MVHVGHHAALWTADEARDLGTLGGTYSEAYALNNLGHVVGSAQTAAGAWHAFLYRDGVMKDLNDFLPPGSPWLLQNAWAINDCGQIVGSITVNGEKPRLSAQAPLATPTPTAMAWETPATTALMCPTPIRPTTTTTASAMPATTARRLRIPIKPTRTVTA